MSNEVLKYLHDILCSIESIEEFLGPQRNFNVYRQNRMLKRAVEREYEIIGEALNKALKIDPEIQISDKNKIIAFRNRVIHGYDTVDDSIVWGIIVKYLPVLKNEVSTLLENNT